MNEFEQKIKELAEKYRESGKFIYKLEESIDKLPQNEKGNFFLEVGSTLFKFSYFVLALDSWNHALKHFVLNFYNLTSSIVSYVTSKVSKGGAKRQPANINDKYTIIKNNQNLIQNYSGN